METKTIPSQLQTQLYSLLVPEEILKDFEICNLTQRASEVVLVLKEKPDKIPVGLKGKEVVLDGYMNDLELQSFPLQGKRCYLKIKRRRWKEQGSDGKQSYWNEYSFAAEGTKATQSFGAFLKEYLS